ncbi:MAG: helix-turn-helix transcriptional regulator [Bacteroidota bacterium]|nr:helix-turn-helix transcriptional regulator [Bacteroidota bacterium]
MGYGINKRPADYLQELAQRLRNVRKELGLSQAELADRSGVSLGSLKRFELSGQISLESLLKLMHVLDRLRDFDEVLKPQENLKNIEKLFSDKTRK